MIQIEKEIEKVVTLLMDTTSDIVRKKYEEKVEKLEMQLEVLRSDMNKIVVDDFPKILNDAFEILQDPLKTWNE